MFLTRISVGQPVFAAMIMIAIMVFGLVAYRELPIEEYPNVDFPVVAIITTYSGASPESVETEVTKVIEESVNTLSGIDTLSSTSSSGLSLVIIQFDLETDGLQDAQEVRDKLAGIALPDDAAEPRVLRYNPSDTPVVALALSSPTQSLVELTRLAEDKISPALANLDGVGSADVVGALDEQVDIVIDPARLSAYKIGITEVLSALAQDNLLIPAGNIIDGVNVQTVQVNSEVDEIDDFSDIVVSKSNGQIVTLGDVSDIRLGESDLDGLAYRNGQQALAINVSKIDGGNTVAIARDVHKVIAELSEGTQLGDAKIEVLKDNSIQIQHNFETVQSTLIEGGVLAVVIVFLFLNSWRSTVITGLTLPISILGTLAVVNAFGFSLNMVTMIALTLCIGILIDDAIVVRENITRHLHMGKSHPRAALDGTNEIGLAVLATTLSIVAVFLPLAFMKGIVGKFFLQFGVTVSVAVLISLFVSFTLDPMLSSVWYDPDAQPGAKRGLLGRLIDRFDHAFERLTGVYTSVLGWGLGHRIVILGVALMAFVSSFLLLPLVGFEFIPATDRSQIAISLQTPIGSSQEYTAIKANQIDAVARSLDTVESTYSNINSGYGSSGENEGSITVNLVPIEDRLKSDSEVLVELREALSIIPGVDLTLSTSGGIGGGNLKPITLNIRGDDFTVLSETASRIVETIKAIPGATDIRMNVEDAQPMVDLVVNREAASDLGLSASQVGAAMRTMIAGNRASEWDTPEGSRIDVVVRLPEADRQGIEGLLDLPVAQQRTGATPVAVTLGQVATLDQTYGPNEIQREALTRQITITGNVAGRVLGDVVQDIDKALAEMAIPESVSISQGGEAELLEDTTSSMASTLMMAIVFIYLVLASQFGSFLQPVAIMMALPLSLVGVMVGLLIGHSTLNMMSLIGFVLLMGLVVKNAILLVDNANHRVRDGLPLREALLAAGKTRFRPIIMTTLAMIFGMLPLALMIHPGSEQNAPMAHAVIGGLVSSTLLTLLVVPVMLTYVDAFSRWIGRFLPKAPHAEAQSAG